MITPDRQSFQFPEGLTEEEEENLVKELFWLSLLQTKFPGLGEFVLNLLYGGQKPSDSDSISNK